MFKIIQFADIDQLSVVIANLIGTVFLEYTWDACALCSIEGFPTVIRAIALGTGSMSARIGAILAPQILYIKVNCNC